MFKQVGVMHKLVILIVSIVCVFDVMSKELIKPLFVINFEREASEFNNLFAAKERLGAGVGEAEFVLVAKAKDEAGYSLVLERVNRISESLNMDFRLVVKYPEHAKDADSVFVYRVPAWDANTKLQLINDDYVYVPEFNSYLSSDEKRYYVSEINKVTIVPTGFTLKERVEHLFNEIGWSVSLDELEGLESGDMIPAIEVVLLNNVATSTEVSRLMEFLADELLTAYGYEVLASERKVILKFKKGELF